MADPLFVDFIEIQASGIPDVAASVQELSDAAAEAAGRTKALAGTLADPAFRAAALTMERNRQAQQHMLDIERQRQQLTLREGDLSSGAHLQRLRERNALMERAAQLSAQEARNAMTVRRENLDSGQAARMAGERARVALDEERLSKREATVQRRADLDARYGRGMGGLIAASESPLARGAAGLATVAAASGLAMARSGFSGTVEMNKLQWEMTLLNRELASALVPAIRELTSAVQWARRQLQGMDGGQQQLLGYGILGVSGLAAINALTRALGAGNLMHVAGALNARMAAAGAASAGPIGIAAAAGIIGANALSPGSNPNRNGGGDDNMLSRSIGFSGRDNAGLPLRAAYNLFGMVNKDANEATAGKFERFAWNNLGWNFDLTGKGKGKENVTPMIPTLYGEAGDAYDRFSLAASNLISPELEKLEEINKKLGEINEKLGKDEPAKNKDEK